MRYFRRFKAEVSDGIGSWMNCLETLAQISIFLNCATLYFTSKVYVQIFVGENHGDSGTEVTGTKVTDTSMYHTITDGWDLTSFLVMLILVEHSLLVLKIVIEQLIEDTPPEIVEGERERKAISDKYQDNTGSDDFKPDQGGLTMNDTKENTFEGNGLTQQEFAPVRLMNEEVMNMEE